MSKKLPKSEWDKAAEWWDAEVGDTGTWHQKHDIEPVILKLLGKITNKKILEVGCGNGYLSRILARKGAKVTAIDLSDKFIFLAKEREKRNLCEIDYLVRDAANLVGIKNRYFDVVIANMSLMDIADARKTMKEISRVLKKNGRFIFSINHPVFCDTPWVMVEKNKKRMLAKAVDRYLLSYSKKFTVWESGAKATHHHRSIETYLRYLQDVGFRVNDFEEISTKKPVTKATKEDGDVALRGSKYKTATEKKMKEYAHKEIPMFLIVGALKFE